MTNASIDLAGLQAYMAADARARKMLDARMDEAAWHRKQERYLEWAGLILGFVIVMAFLYAAYRLVAGGQPWAGTALGTIDIVAVAGMFVWRNPRTPRAPAK